MSTPPLGEADLSALPGEVEPEGPVGPIELWKRVRWDSRLRHRLQGRRHEKARMCYGVMKGAYNRQAVAASPACFLVFPDPSRPDL